jgi:hypothetical protein
MSYATRRRMELSSPLTHSEQECMRAIHRVICTRHALPGLEDLSREVATSSSRLQTVLCALQRKRMVERSNGSIALTYQGIQLLEEQGLPVRF